MAAEPVFYGLANCDTCRKARRWLDTAKISYRYHDVRADGLDAAALRNIASRVDWKLLVNRRSTTWRKLDESERNVADEKSVLRLLSVHPTLMKRPVLIMPTGSMIGFDAELWHEALA